MMKKLTISLMTGLAMVIATSSCEHKREARKVTSLMAAADAWSTTNTIGGKATCYCMFVNRDFQLDVVGLGSTNQQDAFVAMIRTNNIQLSRIRFWREKPTHPFMDLVVPEASLLPQERREAETKEKLIRTVSLKQ